MTQKDALNLLLMGNNVFLTGQAGSGKTYVLNVYREYLKKHKIPTAVTASTGIAATHINGGTIHSFSGIGIKSELTKQDINRIIANETKRERIYQTKVLIIDEISMFHGYRLDMVNHICKSIKQDSRPFGGMQVILCGDFFQLPPIPEQGQEQSNFAYKSDSWEELNLTICYLQEQHRQIDDSFLKVLNDIRSQDVTEYTFEKLQTRLNKEIQNGLRPTKLYTHNIDVNTINTTQLEKIDKPTHTFRMTAEGNTDLIQVLKKGCLAPEEVHLKEGALVMFIKNNPAKGYINGTMGIVTGFSEDGQPKIQTYDGKEIIATQTSWQIEEDDNILAQICQVPLRLAWAITVHKSQGMSLDAAEIDLSKSFAYGMGYVALSRVKTLDGIKLIGINPKAFMVDAEVARFDESLKKLSTEASNNLQQVSKHDMKKTQEDYLQSIMPKDDTDQKITYDITELFNKFFG